jgi:hypothetical protein
MTISSSRAGRRNDHGRRVALSNKETLVVKAKAKLGSSTFGGTLQLMQRRRAHEIDQIPSQRRLILGNWYFGDI